MNRATGSTKQRKSGEEITADGCVEVEDGIAFTEPRSDPIVEVVFRVPASTRRRIDARQHASGYATRASFIVDSCLRSPLPQYEELAARIGRIGMLADLLLIEPGTLPLSRREARRVAVDLRNAAHELIVHLHGDS